MKRFLIILCFFLASCSNDDAGLTERDNSLSTFIENTTIEIGAVIACAASDIDNTSQVNVYFYPESGAENFRLYETEFVDLNPNDLSNYMLSNSSDDPFFNGFLREYVINPNQEKWFIVTFTLDNEIKVSNPIRSKQLSKPTSFNEGILIDQNSAQMPVFTWEDNPVGDNAIYFQIVSNQQDDVFSATYTFENQFQYYNTSNVVLNVTEGQPQDLIVGVDYKFTLMDVSEDNWVNTLTLKKNFTVE